MAVKNFNHLPAFRTLNNAVVGAWDNVFQADTFIEVPIPLYSDKSVSVEGTFGTATVAIQGSIDGTNYYTLNDPQGNALTFASGTKRIEAILENVAYIKPLLATPDGTTNIVVNLIAR